MASEHLAAVQKIRQQVIFYLLFLTTEECLQVCGRIVPAEKLAFELCRVWFDEIYFPGTRYLKAIKGDFSTAKAALFEEAFAIEELIELERFHRFFELRIEMLPDKAKCFAAFPANDLWRNLVRHASYVLEEIAPEAAKLRPALIEKVTEALAAAQGQEAVGRLRHMLQTAP